MSDPRQALSIAIDAHGLASDRLVAAEATAGRAREFVRNIERSIEGFAEIDARISNERASAIKAAIADGQEPTFALSAELTAAVAARAEAENRLAAARQAAATLVGEHVEAQTAERTAKQNVEAAAAAVAASEVEAIAVEIERLDAAAMTLRVSLGGGTGCNVAQLAGLGEASKRVLAGNDRTNIVIRNETPWRQAVAFDDRWQAFVKALAADPEAVLKP